jgi:hypothetical protein
MDDRKTERLSTETMMKLATATSLRKLCQQVQSQAAGDMTLPADPTARLIAINTMNNIFDRLDEAIDRYVKSIEK